MSVVPKLRFPEFDGEWKQVSVEDILQVTRGKVLAMPLVDSIKSAEKPYPVYSSQTKMDGLAGFFSEYLFEDAITWTTDGANAGEVRLRKGKFYCTNVCGVLLSEKGYVNNFISEAINRVAKKHVSYVGNPKLMNGVMARIPVVIPSLPEQQKIASFLSSIDKKIDLLRQKKDALELYKKGLMQKIFSQEIRFKQDDGSDFPDWEEVALGDVVRIDSGFAFKSIKFRDHGPNRVIRMSDLKDSEIAKTGGVYVEDCDVNGLERFKLAEADFVFGMSGSLSNYGWIKKTDLPSYLNQRVGRISDNGKGNALFFQYIYLLPETQKLIENSAVGAAQLNISIDFLRNMTFQCPAYEEQNKIAEFLSTLDSKIQNTSSQIEQMETFKKGLLQQMFV